MMPIAEYCAAMTLVQLAFEQDESGLYGDSHFLREITGKHASELLRVAQRICPAPTWYRPQTNLYRMCLRIPNVNVIFPTPWRRPPGLGSCTAHGAPVVAWNRTIGPPIFRVGCRIDLSWGFLLPPGLANCGFDKAIEVLHVYAMTVSAWFDGVAALAVMPLVLCLC